ncbi:MAG: aldehyde dehydrogenase [Chloroflexota bacterium]|nr:aldehyde dehydrogenase [Chloroflexota bacterium]
MNLPEIIQSQKIYFRSGKTLDVAQRLNLLEKLQDSIRQREGTILEALRADLGKSHFEGYMSEVGMVMEELSYMRHNLRRLSRPQRVRTPLAQFSARSYKLPSPYGCALVMSPWNYPFYLSITPTVDALAAGNTVVLKPSAYSPATSEVIAELLRDCFPPEYVTVVTGGREVNQSLLDQPFDYIFFTGSKTVGRLVMEKASAHLTPITLELGGKSPCIVDKSADLSTAAARIAFGKFLNVGQTCVAPDYLIVHEDVKDAFLKLLVAAIQQQYGQHPLENADYGHIINEKHFQRLLGLLQDGTIVTGGQHDGSRRIAPTVITDVTLDSPIMQEEIFGPLLPVLTFRETADIYPIVAANPTPLAFYLFSTDKEQQRELTRRISYGGGCINDTIIHLATSQMGFGGVGESGMGSYHGQAGFDTFTHYKSMVDKANWIDLKMRYQPYSEWKDKLVRMFLK